GRRGGGEGRRRRRTGVRAVDGGHPVVVLAQRRHGGVGVVLARDRDQRGVGGAVGGALDAVGGGAGDRVPLEVDPVRGEAHEAQPGHGRQGGRGGQDLPDAAAVGAGREDAERRTERQVGDRDVGQAGAEAGPGRAGGGEVGRA